MESAIANVDLGRYRRIVQMFWDPEPVNDMNMDQPVWCLGCIYSLSANDYTEPPPQTRHERQPVEPLPAQEHNKLYPAAEKPAAIGTMNANATETESSSFPESFSSSLAYDEENITGAGWPPAFLEDFEARFWMTYRSNFETIAKSISPKAASVLSLSMRIRSQLVDQNGFTSDSGWGCMIRSGQSLLSNTMAILDLGRGWRRGMHPDEERRLIALFADDRRAPYSIHNFVRHGEESCGKYPGEWFGPSATARCIQELVNSREPRLRVYSTGDGPDVYEDNFMRIAKPDGKGFHPTLILVGTRLGIDKITPVYWEALIASLQMTQSVGIAGGRPSSSHYFVGSQGHFLFYLDPHHTRKALPYYADAANYTTEDIDTCHTSRLRRIHIREMDPSMLVGFLIQTEADWFDWKSCVKHVQGKTIIHVADRHPANEQLDASGRSAVDEVEPLSDDEGFDTHNPV
ncbi:Cysteine protease atg4 [Conoideocrella luteorostrata]|uniref:Cysteine protease n=1 Tax=Conoideocrella luteorostrata TaxID=1105319 RepID=A0AAJ0CWE7_9HYPO|nr:Cysteine protease atg4 [Conoideocrella luteorostrata]